MLVLDHVSIHMGQKHWEFNLTLEIDVCHVLLGRSGSGKSTLLNVLGGFLAPDSGNILWNGKSITRLKPADRPVTTLFQQHNLFMHLNVWQNIGLGISPNLKLCDQQRESIKNVLLDVGLQDFDAKMPAQLSGGEQQRVALARCLLRKHPVLLLDEPFSALDATTRQDMIALLDRLFKRYKLCTLMVTHDEADADALGARILRMANGTVSADPNQS